MPPHTPDTAEPQPTELECVAFLDLIEVGEGIFRGGVLVTDVNGKPIEFRCTSAIQPSTFQEIAYGEYLRNHMCIALTAQPLLDALQAKPSVVLVNQRDFMDLRESIKIPLVIVTRQGETVATENNVSDSENSKLLDSPSGKSKPVIITPHWNFPGDIDSTAPGLYNLFSKVDLTEPFSRIKNAVVHLHEKGAVN